MWEFPTDGARRKISPSVARSILTPWFGGIHTPC
ncbi:hypothetical protein AVEN_205255-1, partial [Araneus ventricosus]